MEYQINSASQAETEQLAEKIGVQLRGGEIIELVGDVGAGKTAFVRGLTRGTGSQDRVSSPTFTISNIYSSQKINLYHYDFYRLDDFKIIKNELTEVVSDPKNSVVLEWAEEVKDALPDDYIRIYITTDGENSRNFNLSVPPKFNYIKIDSW